MKFFKLTSLVVCTLFVSTLAFAKKSKVEGQETGKYLQEIKNTIVLPTGKSENIIKLIQNGEQIIAVSPGKVFTFQNKIWTVTEIKGDWQSAALDANNDLWLAETGRIFNAGKQTSIDFPYTIKGDTIFCLLWEDAKTLHLGTSRGLWTWTEDKWSVLKGTEGKSVRGITEGKGKDLWLAASNGIFRRRDSKWTNLSEFVMSPGLETNFKSIANGAKKEDVIFGNHLALSQISENGNHWMLTKEDGLPYGPVSTIVSTKNGLWLGTEKGAIKRTDKWDYYFGKRWLPDNKINDILEIDENTVWLATPKGISEIKNIEISLPQKSKRFNERITERHIHHGFIADCVFDSPGDTASWKCYSSDNDGLWSSIYLASESFRYAVTGEQDAYDNAVRTFKAMERLETINPNPGFVARSYLTIDEPSPHGTWHATEDGKWKWKADTSSDEIVGHMFAYPIFYKLVAKGEIKERCEGLVHRLMSHIVDNDFHLIDLDGKPTRWGVWSPDSLNNRADWWYESGINSLQILSHLEGAIYITGDEKFEKAYQELITEHHYVENMIQQKMHFPYEINHSDDELAFLPYYSLLQNVRDPELKKQYQKSMQRTWLVEQADRNPLWNIIASSALDKDCDLDVAVQELKDYPMDIIKWTMDNSHRWDIKLNPVADRFLNPQATKVIPVDERGISRWNSNPYKLVQKGNGKGEDDGTAWLLPYWMGRYHGFIIEK
jgi:hypothetical protein